MSESAVEADPDADVIVYSTAFTTVQLTYAAGHVVLLDLTTQLRRAAVLVAPVDAEADISFPMLQVTSSLGMEFGEHMDQGSDSTLYGLLTTEQDGSCEQVEVISRFDLRYLLTFFPDEEWLDVARSAGAFEVIMTAVPLRPGESPYAMVGWRSEYLMR